MVRKQINPDKTLWLFWHRLILTALSLIFSLSGFSSTENNNHVIDSLITRVAGLEQGPEKADALLQIAYVYTELDCDKAAKYGELSFKLAKKIKYDQGIMMAAIRLGKLTGFCYQNLKLSLEYYDIAFPISKQLKDYQLQMDILRNMAKTYVKMGEFDKGMSHYVQAIEIAKQLEDDNSLKFLYIYVGNEYMAIGDTVSALTYFEEIVNMEAEQNFEGTTPYFLFVTGDYYMTLGEHEKANGFFQRSYDLFENEGEYRWASFVCSKQCRLNAICGNHKAAIERGLKGLKIAEERKFLKERIDNYKTLAYAYEQQGDYENSLIYTEKYYNLKDSVSRQEMLSTQAKSQEDFEEVIGELESEKTKGELLAEELESENNELLFFSVAALLIVTILFMLVLYRRLYKGNKLNAMLGEQQEQLRKLSVVAANIEQMVMIVDKDDRIEWVNQAFEKKFGYLKFEVINRQPGTLLAGPKTDRENIDTINHRIFNKKEAFGTTLVQYAKDKKPYYTRLHFTPILNDVGDLERYVVISLDITQEQKVSEQLKELSLVASNTTNAIIIFNRQMKAIWVNDSFTEISGLTKDTVLGKSPLDIYNGPLMSEGEKEDLLDNYRKKENFTLECESTNRITDVSYWISMSVTPVFDEQGELIKYINVATDITELKNLEGQYASLVEGSSDMIFEMDLAGNFVFVNDVTVRATGYSKKMLKNIDFLELIHEDYRAKVAQFYTNQAFERRSVSYLEFPILTKGDEVIWVGQRAKLKLEPNGSYPVGFSIISRDISQNKIAEEALKKTYENASLLSEIGMQITSTLSVVDIIEQVYGNINKLMDANVFGIAIPNQDENKLIFPRIIEKGETIKDLTFSLEDDTWLAVLCYKESREIIMSDFLTDFGKYIDDPSKARPAAGDQTSSLIYLPLLLKGKTIGVITVQSFKRNAYDEYQVSLVRSLASFVAIAMENAALYETMEEKIAERTKEVLKQKEELEVNYFNTRLVSEIGQLVSSTLNIDEILLELYELVGQLMRAEIFGISTFNEVENEIYNTYFIDEGKRLDEVVISLNNENSYVAWCLQNKKEIFINDNRKEYKNYVSKLPTKKKAPRSLIFYPMIVENKLIGVITIQSYQKDSYQAYHLDILKTLASYIGTAIDNAVLYATLETKVKERTAELERKNNDITASINYAKRLQKGILPDQNFMKQLLPESFVYFKPKDIVSGDFYWVDRTHTKILMAVVDCTGHGVPGAMMSIIGRNLLDQAVNEKGITVPSQILNFLQVGLSVAFGQTGDKKADLFDGMDLGICCIDLKTNILEFSGANSSLYLIQDHELITIRGDKVGITAEFQITEPYSNVEIAVQKGDMIYLSSDGFPDQFGGDKYKKFTYGRMQDLFMKIHHLNMETQSERIETALTEWMGDWEQTDDICIMGVRLN